MPNKKILIAAAAVLLLIMAVAFKPIRIALLVLLLLIIAALAVDVVIYINASRDGVDISAKYFGIKVYPRKGKGGDEGEEPDETEPDWDEDDGFEDDLDYEAADTPTEQTQQPEQTSGSQQTQIQAEEETSEDTDTDTSDETPEGEQWDGEPDDDDEPEPKKKGKKRENAIVKKVKSLRAKYEKYKPYIPMAWKGFRQLCKTIRFYIDDAWVDVGRFDAHEAAIYYGSIQAVIAETFKDIAVMFTLKPRNVKRCDVNVKWGENCIDGGIKMRVKLRLLTIVGILISMAVKYLYIKFSSKRRSKAKNETSAENVQPE